MSDTEYTSRKKRKRLDPDDEVCKYYQCRIQTFSGDTGFSKENLLRNNDL